MSVESRRRTRICNSTLKPTISPGSPMHVTYVEKFPGQGMHWVNIFQTFIDIKISYYRTRNGVNMHKSREHKNMNAWFTGPGMHSESMLKGNIEGLVICDLYFWQTKSSKNKRHLALRVNFWSSNQFCLTLPCKHLWVVLQMKSTFENISIFLGNFNGFFLGVELNRRLKHSSFQYDW